MNIFRSRKIRLYEILKERYLKLLSKNKTIITVITNPENIFYFTGFWGEGLLIIKEDLFTNLVVPKLEYSRANKSSRDCEITSSERGTAILDTILNWINSDNYVFVDNTFLDIINSIGKKIEKKNQIIIDKEIIYEIRKIKQREEIDNIQKASNIIDKLYKIASNEIKLNQTEEEIQASLVYEALKQGARFPFYQFTSNPLIIASGSNSSFPHSETSNRKIKSGDLVVIDITLSYNHYISDATRTFAIERISKEKEKIYQIVKESQDIGIQHLKKADNFATIDKSCRDIIDKANYGNQFIHSTGHGIGLEVHEPPWIRPNYKSEIKENMTITIEPGIYIENKFGVRIEDSILITKKTKSENFHDIKNFHSFTKDLLIL